MIELFENYWFADRLVFIDEAIFQLSGQESRHNARIWGSENPKEFMEYGRGPPKLNVFVVLATV